MLTDTHTHACTSISVTWFYSFRLMQHMSEKSFDKVYSW